jgi:hypothetical protein
MKLNQKVRLRFLDPVVDPNNPNLYTYCGNNPIMRSDPSGQFWQIIIPALIGGIYAYANGGDFMQGFVMGLMTGMLSAGIGEALSGTALSDVLGPMGTQMLSGGISGGVISMMSGGDFWSGVGMGAFSAGVGYGLDKLIPGGMDIFNSNSPVTVNYQMEIIFVGQNLRVAIMGVYIRTGDSRLRDIHGEGSYYTSEKNEAKDFKNKKWCLCTKSDILY